MTTDGMTLIGVLNKAMERLGTIDENLSTGESDAALWGAELTLAQVRDAIRQGSFIAASRDDEAEIIKILLNSTSRAMVHCGFARNQLFWWERRNTVAQIQIEVARIREVLRRTDFYTMPHPGR